MHFLKRSNILNQWLSRLAILSSISILNAETQPVANIPSGTAERTENKSASRSSLSSSALNPADFTSLEATIKDFTQVASPEGSTGFYRIWKRDKDQQLLAELPKDYLRQRHFIALTVAGGEEYAGLQCGEIYGYWKRYNNKLAFIEPNINIRSTGDASSKSSIERLFTDRILFEVPIVSVNPATLAPIIDLDALLVGQAEKFFGRRVNGINKNLFTLKTVKTFQKNTEIGIELPVENGQLRTLHYSISEMPNNTGYKPRKADHRVGYFTTGFDDYGKFSEEDVPQRYINRWHLEKADPSLKLSPPKTPIIFYIEHTCPVRYRRWVQEGVLAWNKAFEKVGLVNTIEVRFQDAATGEHMEKDPEDVRYNFVRWLSNNNGTAIGPSRVHPLTGQILDADIILTDGWIRHWSYSYNEVLPRIATEGLTPEALQWMWENPQWDPRVRLAEPTRRTEILEQRKTGTMPFLGGHEYAAALNPHHHDHFTGETSEIDGSAGRLRQRNGLCMAPNCKAMDLAHLDMAMNMDMLPELKANPNEQMLDGIPESVIGPLLVDLVAHEVGHTLGLRHNFKASSVYTIDEMKGGEGKERKPLASSVMDYIPVVLPIDSKAPHPDYAMTQVGPYDNWAIEYGYTFATDLKPILERSAEPELAFGTDEDTLGPDPTITRHDLAKDPMSYAKMLLELAQTHRSKLLSDFVKKGDSWNQARRGYLITLSAQTRATTMMSRWLGGTYISRSFKGDPNATPPVVPVPANLQREALTFCLETGFRDAAYGLTPELLTHMGKGSWITPRVRTLTEDDSAWPVHERILAVQASLLSRLMNPVTLARIYDNEMRVNSEEEYITLPEVLNNIHQEIWSELGTLQDGASYSERKPFISSLRRNLQREYLDRSIDLATKSTGSPASKVISDLSMMQLRNLQTQLKDLGTKPSLDAYSRSHLQESAARIERAINQLMISSR